MIKHIVLYCEKRKYHISRQFVQAHASYWDASSTSGQGRGRVGNAGRTRGGGTTGSGARTRGTSTVGQGRRTTTTAGLGTSPSGRTRSPEGGQLPRLRGLGSSTLNQGHGRTQLVNRTRAPSTLNNIHRGIYSKKRSIASRNLFQKKRSRLLWLKTRCRPHRSIW